MCHLFCKKKIEKIKKSEYVYLGSSKLTQPSSDFPIYYFDNQEFNVLPNTLTSCVIDYIRRPLDPAWVFTTGSSGQYVYDSNNSQDFEIHESDETDLVLKILAYAGVVIKDPTVIQVAQQQETNNVTLENS